MRKTPTRRATITVCYTWSSSQDEAEDKESEKNISNGGDYLVSEVSEVSESFTLIKPFQTGRLAPVVESANEDTDIEADDELKEYSEVRMEDPQPPPHTEVKPKPRRTRKSTVIGKETVIAPVSSAPKAHVGSCCSTNCAHTYTNARERRRRAISTIISPFRSDSQVSLINNNSLATKQVNSTSEDTESPEDTSEQVTKQRVRKKSRFAVKGQSEEKKAIEGTYKLVGSINYEEYLALLGTGPCSQDMVMRADMVLTIEQEADKQWRICNETLIKAKSVRGYRTNNRKWTENKFMASEPKPELLDDWDQRLIVTTLEVSPEGTRLTLNQIAEKDQWHRQDSTVVLEVDSEEGKDVLVMTCMAGTVVAWRKFQRQIASGRGAASAGRKISSPF